MIFEMKYMGNDYKPYHTVMIYMVIICMHKVTIGNFFSNVLFLICLDFRRNKQTACKLSCVGKGPFNL